jgi:hypothetical protein
VTGANGVGILQLTADAALATFGVQANYSDSDGININSNVFQVVVTINDLPTSYKNIDTSD